MPKEVPSPTKGYDVGPGGIYQPSGPETGLRELFGDTYTLYKVRDASSHNDWTMYKVMKWKGDWAQEPEASYDTGFSDRRGMVCSCPGGQRKFVTCKHMDLVQKYRRQGEPEGAMYHYDEPSGGFVRVAAQRRFGGIQSVVIGQNKDGHIVLQFLVPYKALGFTKEEGLWSTYEKDPDYHNRLIEDLQNLLKRNIGFLTPILVKLGVKTARWVWLEKGLETDYYIERGTPDLMVFQTRVVEADNA